MTFSLYPAMTGKLSALGLLLTASVTILSACAESPQDVMTQAEENNVTLEEVAGNAENLMGQTVSIRGEVRETVDDVSFLLTGNQLFGNDDILIINATNERFLIPDVGDSQVQVKGEAQQFFLADIETAYDLDLDPDLYATYEELPAIIAQSMALAPDPGDVTANPEEFYNQAIAVEGKVAEKLAADIFTIAEERLFGGEDLLVIGQADAPMMRDEETVVVTGVLRPYIAAEFEREYDFDWDATLQERIEAEFTEVPVFVADGIYPSAVE